ncbi:coiled-coil domain-containing protein 43 isoform 2-T2 [Menidia menidia]
MAAPLTDAGEFESWLNDRLDSLEVDRDVYGAYILGILQEEENDEEKEDALQGILSAFLDEDTMEDVCKQIIKQWTEFSRQSAARKNADAEVQAIASMIEKQAQIVVRQKEVTEESKKRKEALLAQYANVTDEEEYPSVIYTQYSEVPALSLTSSLKLKWRSQRMEMTSPQMTSPCSRTPTLRRCSTDKSKSGIRPVRIPKRRRRGTRCSERRTN